MISVSIIIPIHNAEQYIDRCIRSLQGQTQKQIELIFVNDCCTDGSMKIVQNLIDDKSHDYIVKVLSNSERLGVSESRKKGALSATGEYIGWVDADDWVEPETYEKMYNIAVLENADIVVSNSIWHYADQVKYMEYKHNKCPIDGLLKMYDHRYLPYQLWSHLIMIRDNGEKYKINIPN